VESVIHLSKIRCFFEHRIFFINVTSSQKKTLSCGMIKLQSINKKDVANMKINHDAGYLQAEKQRIIKDQRKESFS